MDLIPKKRKADDNAAALTPEDALKILELFSRNDLLSIVSNFSHEDLLSIISTAMVTVPSSSVLSSIRAVADVDPAKRKLIVRGLRWDTTADDLHYLFSSFGELEEPVTIFDKKHAGKYERCGFVTFRHVDGAFLALKEPSKKIDGRRIVTQLASSGNTDRNKEKPGSLAANPDPKPTGEAPIPGSIPSQFGGLGPGLGRAPHGGLSAAGGLPGHHHMNSPLSGISAGLTSMRDQLPLSMLTRARAGGLEDFGRRVGASNGSSQYSGPGAGGFGGSRMDSTHYNWMPPSSGGVGPEFYPEGGQQPQQPGSSLGQRVPPRGGMYQGMHNGY